MIPEQQIETALSRMFDGIEFQDEPRGLYDPLRYMIAIGGKRIRPRLCLTVWSLFRDNLSDEVLVPASALEVFHSFTLIHDDIMDCSPKRRSRPTVWVKWSEDTAILSGDVMLIDAYKRIARTPVRVLDSVMQLFSKTAAEVCDGQQYDMEFESVPEVSMADYEKMIGLKTAVLIACSAKMGAIIAGASAPECKALYNYGYQLGMAFQIADDYLDAFGDEKVFGKPIGGDIINRKKSWLTVRALEKTGDKQAFLSAFEAPCADDAQKVAKIERVKGIYSSLGVDRDAKQEIVRFTSLAMRALDGLNLGEERSKVLRNFADALVGRAV